MKGRFTYSNQPLVTPAVLFGAVLTGCLMAFHSSFAIPALLLTVILTLGLTHIPGCYEADSAGVTFKILWRTHSFAYSEIRSVKTETGYGGKSRFDDTFRVTAKLTLRTDSGVYNICSQQSVSLNDQIKDPEQFKKQMDELNLIQLGRYLQSQIQPQKEARG